MARPRKPVHLKLIEGDTRQRGAKKHAESLKGAVDGPTGFVEPPAGLPQRAERHFREIVVALDAMGVLSTADQGVITSAALAYAGMMQAATGKLKNWKTVSDCIQRYHQAADRLGLNPSARSRLPKQETPKVNPIDAKLA